LHAAFVRVLGRGLSLGAGLLLLSTLGRVWLSAVTLVLVWLLLVNFVRV